MSVDMQQAEKAPTGSGARRQFSAFVLVGGLAAAINWGSRFAFSALGMSLDMAVVCAYVMGMVTAYVLSRRFVFERTGQAVHHEVLRFVIVNMFSMAQVWLVTIALDFWLPQIGFSWHPAALAHAVGVVSPVGTSYFGHRYFTFRNKAQSSSVTPDLPAVAKPSAQQ